MRTALLLPLLCCGAAAQQSDGKTASLSAEPFQHVFHESSSAYWARAYVFNPSDGAQTVAAIVYQSPAWAQMARRALSASICTFDDEVAVRVVINDGDVEARTEWQPYMVYCTFARTNLKASQNSVLRFRDISAEVFDPVKLYGEQKAPGLSVCVATLYGDSINWRWVQEWVEYYRVIHGMDRLFVYTDEKQVAKHIHGDLLDARLNTTVVDISAHAYEQWYHSQKLVMLDCWLHNLALGAEWVLFLDFDEILTWPYEGRSWKEVFPADIPAVTFATWPQLVSPCLPRPGGVGGGDSRGPAFFEGMYAQDDPLCTMGGSIPASNETECRVSADGANEWWDCCRCRTLNTRRKFALQGTPAAHRHPYLVTMHRPLSVPDVADADPFVSGMVVRHYHGAVAGAPEKVCQEIQEDIPRLFPSKTDPALLRGTAWRC